MGCGCNQMNHEQGAQMVSSNPEIISDELTGKNIRHSTGKILTISSPIRDINGDIIGYITNNQEGKVIRIFAKDVSEVL